METNFDIGVKYADKQHKQFDEEKMKAGQCVIGLQVIDTIPGTSWMFWHESFFWHEFQSLIIENWSLSWSFFTRMVFKDHSLWGLNLQYFGYKFRLKTATPPISVTREMGSRTQMQRIDLLIIKLNKTKNKTTPKGKNKQAGRRLGHSQTWNTHVTHDTWKTTDQHRTADTRRTI